MQADNDNADRQEASRLLPILGRVRHDGVVVLDPSPPAPREPNQPPRTEAPA